MMLTGVIVGKVLSDRGSHLSGVKVACEGRETLTLADGSYRLEHLEPMAYRVEVAIQGFEPLRKEIVVRDKEEAVVDFCLREKVGTGAIRGQILDESSGRPIPCGTVMLILPLANKYAPVGSDGSYEFRDLPAGNYELWVSAYLHEEEKVTTALGNGEMRILDVHCRQSNRVEPLWG